MALKAEVETPKVNCKATHPAMGDGHCEEVEIRVDALNDVATTTTNGSRSHPASIVCLRGSTNLLVEASVEA